jgi:SulP family sulfate permease
VSRDFVGQGVANLGAGVFRGMPVGGSLSASSLNQAAGARSRLSLLIAGVVIAVVVVAFGGLVGSVAMPALAGLLILIGCRTIKLADLRSVWLTGPVQKVVLVVTFALTMIIPLQYAVLVGVGLSVVLHVIRQSNQVVLKLRQRDAEGHVIEVDPPTVLPADEVVVLQPYGSLFFAAAPVFESLLPAPNNSSSNTVVILRLRGRDDLGATLMDVLGRYADALATVGSKLVLVSTNSSIEEQLEVAGVTGKIGRSNLYRAEPRVGAAMDRANADARAWIARDRPDQDPDTLA